MGVIGETAAADDALFVVSSALLLVTASCLASRAPWLAQHLARMARAWRAPAVVDELGHIVQEKMQRQKVSHFRSFGHIICFLVFLSSGNMVVHIARRQPRLHTHLQDVVHTLLQGASLLALVRPGIISGRTVAPLHAFSSLCGALYVAPWACRPEFAVQALSVANLGIAALATVTRCTLAVGGGSTALFTASACSLLWVHGEHVLMRPSVLVCAQILVMALILGCNQVLDRSVASMIRQGLEAQAAREVLSAASALLKSCCDVVVELDTEGAIVGPARDLSSFLLRQGAGGGSLQGVQLVDLMASEEDRRFLADKLREPWAGGSGLADVRHVGVKDGNGEVLSLELLWFQFRHLDQQLRYMVGLKEFTDPALSRQPPGTAEWEAAAPPPPPLPPLPSWARGDEGGADSIPEGISVATDSVGNPPAVVTVDTTVEGNPVRECPDEVRQRLGRLPKGRPLNAHLKNPDHFEAWLRRALRAAAEGGEAPRDCRLVFLMPQGKMEAMCRLEEPEAWEGAAVDPRELGLELHHVRRCGGSSLTPSQHRGTPLNRVSM